MKTQEETIWLRTGFAFPSGDRCQCHRHRSGSGRSARCRNRDCVIMLKHPVNRTERLFCLDCWARCRDEKTVPDPAQQRMYAQMRREGMTPAAIGR